MTKKKIDRIIIDLDGDKVAGFCFRFTDSHELFSSTEFLCDSDTRDMLSGVEEELEDALVKLGACRRPETWKTKPPQSDYV